MKKAPHCCGFTLVELLITLAIAAVLLSVATPSFKSFIASNQVKTHARDLGSALGLARSEAIALGEVTVICGSSDGSTCNASNDWSAGWIVFIDDGAGIGTANDELRSGDEEILLVYEYDGKNTVNVFDDSSLAVNAIGFRARGSVRQDVAMTIRICEETNEERYARAILLERTGLVVRSFDAHDSGGAAIADGIYEDVTGTNLVCL